MERYLQSNWILPILFKKTKNMKTILYTFLCLFLCQSINLNAQNNNKGKTFLRVCNLDGKKMAKGYFILATDSTLKLKKRSKVSDISITSIGQIKTKRSGGNNILTSSLVGMSIGAVFGVATADPDAWTFNYSASEGAASFGLLGAIGGATIGGVISGIKNRETFIINGDVNKWLIFKEFIQN
jgi:hypothetical protein